MGNCLEKLQKSSKSQQRNIRHWLLRFSERNNKQSLDRSKLPSLCSFILFWIEINSTHANCVCVFVCVYVCTLKTLAKQFFKVCAFNSCKIPVMERPFGPKNGSLILFAFMKTSMKQIRKISSYPYVALAAAHGFGTGRKEQL